MNTIIYVDGFNLYYGAVKGTPYRWLNIQRMCELLLLPTDTIKGICYFTAKVLHRKHNPAKNIRQQVYLRALKTIPNLEIIYGHYSEHVKSMRLARPLADGTKFMDVIRTEEKGSDVNLAVRLLHDGCKRRYELAVVVSNDSDLLSAVQIVQDDLGLSVGVLNPQQQHPSIALQREAKFFKTIRSSVLSRSQFPDVMQDARGTFYKPPSW